MMCRPLSTIELCVPRKETEDNNTRTQTEGELSGTAQEQAEMINRLKMELNQTPNRENQVTESFRTKPKDITELELSHLVGVEPDSLLNLFFLTSGKLLVRTRIEFK